MQPLKVIFHLRSPVVVPENPVHLDALLAWVAVDRSGDLAAQEDLPLERYGKGDRWVWKASWLEFAGITQRWQMDYIRRFDSWKRTEDYRRGVIKRWLKIKRNTGPDRAYSIFAPVMRASHAQAYCVGDRDQVESMLSEITHLGKLRRLGYGEVDGLDVLPVEDGWERWQFRVMPEKQDGYAKVWACLRPPYWKRSNRVEAYAPGSEAWTPSDPHGAVAATQVA